MKIFENKDSNSKFIFYDDYVLKRFLIESGLHYDVAIRLFEYYKQIGLNVEYDTILVERNNEVGYFITKFPIVKTLHEPYKNGKEEIDTLLKEILNKNPISILENCQNKLKNKICVHSRDVKGRNLFKHKDKTCLLDVADFYFTIEDNYHNIIMATEDQMAELEIVPYEYEEDSKYSLPDYMYTYQFKSITL